jgi:diguanylate cyclase (GGDEF)-like protein
VGKNGQVPAPLASVLVMEPPLPSSNQQEATIQLATVKLISGGMAVGFLTVAVMAQVEPEWVRYLAASAAGVSALFTVVLSRVRTHFPLVARAILALLMAALFIVGLSIQPASLGTISGFVFLGIAVGIGSYETFSAAVVMSLAAVAFGVLSIVARSSVVAPAAGVFIAVAGVSLFAVFGFRRVAKRANEQAIADSLTDPLTGMTNRRGLTLGTTILGAVAERSGQRLGCLILDLDHFKAVNDGYGHATGDRVLVSVAQAVQRIARRGDLLVRVGGEEFALFTVVSQSSELKAIGERVRLAVEQLDISPRVTTSVGGALHSSGPNNSLESLMMAADSALYLAKESGRNLVRMADD